MVKNFFVTLTYIFFYILLCNEYINTNISKIVITYDTASTITLWYFETDFSYNIKIFVEDVEKN